MWCNPWGIWWDEVRASDILRLDADGEIVEGKWDVTPGGVPAHRAAPCPRRRHDHRAQPSVLRDVARGDERDAAGSCTRTRASSTASSRSSTSTRVSKTRSTASGSRRRSATRAASCSRTTARSSPARRSARRATRRSPSSACAASPTTSSPPAAARRDTRRSSAPTLKAAAAPEHAARRTGTARSASCSLREPEVLDMNMSLDDLAGERGVRRRQGPARADHLAARARAARARVHRDLRRRPRGRTARRVHRPLPEAVRRRGTARRRHRRRRRGVGVAGPAAPQRRVQRGRRAAVDANTASSRRASTRCAAAPGT